MTVQELIAEALELIGAHSPFEQLSGADADLGLRYFNILMDDWKAERLNIPQVVRSTYSLVANTSSYTIGTATTLPAVDFSVQRPVFIQAASYYDGTAETPLKIADDDEWAAIAEKTTTADQPEVLYYTEMVPNGTIYLYPVPAVTGTLVLYLPSALDEQTSLSTVIYLQPGYRSAIINSLAVRLAPAFGKAPNESIGMAMVNSMGRIRANNGARPRISTKAFTGPRELI